MLADIGTKPNSPAVHKCSNIGALDNVSYLPKTIFISNTFNYNSMKFSFVPYWNFYEIRYLLKVSIKVLLKMGG